jgi:hypothetical protein
MGMCNKELILNKIFKNSVALDGNPEPDLVHATGCKQPTLKELYVGNLEKVSKMLCEYIRKI